MVWRFESSSGHQFFRPVFNRFEPGRSRSSTCCSGIFFVPAFRPRAAFCPSGFSAKICEHFGPRIGTSQKALWQQHVARAVCVSRDRFHKVPYIRQALRTRQIRLARAVLIRSRTGAHTARTGDGWIQTTCTHRCAHRTAHAKERLDENNGNEKQDGIYCSAGMEKPSGKMASRRGFEPLYSP